MDRSDVEMKKTCGGGPERRFAEAWLGSGQAW